MGVPTVWVLSICLTASVEIPVLIIGEDIAALPCVGFGLLSILNGLPR